MKTYTVRAKRWEHGWELHVNDVGVTQAHSLAEADKMARSYIIMLTHEPSDTFDVDIIPEIGDGLDQAARKARKAVRDAEAAQREAAKEMRQVTSDLRKHGLTGRDIARVLDVAPQRVSQLLGSSEKRRANG